MSGKVNLELLVRDGCHLCDAAQLAVNRVLAEVGDSLPNHAFELVLRQVDSEPALLERYNDEVPVLFVNGEQRAFWRIDERQLRDHLLRICE